MDDDAIDGAGGAGGTVEGAIRFGQSIRVRQPRPGAGAIAMSILIHAAALSVFFITGVAKHKPIVYEQIAIHLVSPAPTVAVPPLPVETTSAVAEAPKVETATPKPAEKPKPRTQSATNDKVVSKPTNPKPAQGRRPKPGPVGGEDLNIVQEGVAFAYPDYSNNVIKKLLLYFRWNKQGNLTADVSFYIRRDGSVGSPEVVRSSGTIEFDIAAVSAVENAGRQKAFGPLPAGWQGTRLPITFTFAPNN
jgi:TonB family protein